MKKIHSSCKYAWLVVCSVSCLKLYVTLLTVSNHLLIVSCEEESWEEESPHEEAESTR